ncbi:MAG: response regulator [Spirochaetales bacterium]|nr:response regulator [Spirochaetales bacterium]
MFRILLIDDEPHHIEHLTKIITSSEMPFTICGTAFDGQSALELYIKQNPDLIISDIKMPMKNGLIMTEELKVLNKEIPVILISAYQDFEYARKGLQLGILDYLLKPIEENELKGVLQKAEQLLTASRTNMLRRSLFSVPGKEKSFSPDIEKSLRALGSYRLALYISQPEGENLEKLWYQSGRNCPGEILELETRPDGCRLFLFTEGNTNNVRCFKDSGIQKGQIILSDLNPHILSWDTLCREMNERIWEAATWGGSGISYISQDFPFYEETTPFIQYEWELKIALAGDLKKDFQPLLVQILEEYQSRKPSIIQLKEAISLMDRILIKNYAFKKNISDSHIRRILEKLNMDLVRMNFDLQDIAAGLTDALSAAVPEEVCRSYSIQKVKEYMDSNYAQNIDTTSLADMTGVSAKTLNHLFLSEFGVSPSKYLIEIRMEVAKKLLSTRPDLQIKEIANETGYEDPLYFSRIFHRKVGMNPTQYRTENQSSATTI